MIGVRGFVRVLGPLMGMLAVLAFSVTIAHAAEPAGTPGTGGDPRSPGEGPGLVGDPAFAILAVLGIGLLSLVLTLLYVRVTAARNPPPPRT